MTAEFEAEIKRLEGRLSEEDTALATATSEKTNAEEAARLKEKLKEQQITDYESFMETCRINKENLATEVCGFKKIRTELYKVKGDKIIIQDCKVSEWTHEECTATCDGGILRKTRTILMAPHNGMECGPLEEEYECNKQACPVDCVLGDWSEWSECSAECGGGVREKTRSILTDTAHGGLECGKTSVAENCAMGSCSKDCTLSDWSEWSTCSQGCKVAHDENPVLKRTKNVVVEATGGGKCWDLETPFRSLQAPCNEKQTCEKLAWSQGTEIIHCESKLDIIVIIEGSSYANNEIFKRFKNAASKFVQGMVPKVEDEERVKVGVILVEGPENNNAYKKCVSKPAIPGAESTTTEAPPDMKKDCGVTWVHHLYDKQKTEDIVEKIGALKSKLDTLPLTSAGLVQAQQEFAFGREDAKSIVVMFTDGHPASPGETGKAAKALQEDGVRMMWQVTYFAGFGDTEKWASHPLHMNFVKTTDPFIDSSLKINEIISKICPVLTGGPQNTGEP